MIQKLFFIVLFFLPIMIKAQDIGINHFERKAELKEVYLPSDEYDSDPFQISFPDSLYSFATIKIKKAILPKTKASIEFNVQDNLFHAIKISVKRGRKRDNLLVLLEEKLGAEISDSKTQCFQYNNSVVKLSTYSIKRTYYYTFTLETCDDL